MNDDLLLQLNPEQKQAVLHTEKPALVLAGAGSGKTRVLTSRAAYLVQHKHVPTESILLVTFTNKAAGEMTERVQKMTGRTLLFSGTFHRLCAKILRKDGHFIGISPSFVIYDTDDQLSLIKTVLKAVMLSPKEYHPRLMLDMISKAKIELISPGEYQRVAHGKYQSAAATCYVLYEKKLAKNNAVDFDNLLNKTLELFTVFPEVLQRYQRQFEYVLVDEYQDVNKAQYSLTKLLALPQNNLFCVGDFSQSIYGWRGADYRNMLAFTQDFPKYIEYKLERNYRSIHTIVAAATALIAHNTSHPILELWTDKKDNSKIKLFEAETEKEEAEYVVRECQKLRVASSLSFSDMVILYRTNAQSRIFEDACMRFGVPYRLVGGVRFYARKEVKDVFAYIRLFMNEYDEVSLYRLEKLGKKQLEKYLTWVRNTKNLPDTPLDILDTILEITGYQHRYNSKLEEDLSRLENIRELRSVASEFSSLTAFLENVALVENDTLPDIGTVSNSASAVTLMSMHSAKGLEFEAVFLVGLEEGLFPHSRSLLDKHQLEEERRLCYVGITRAKYRLYVTYAKRRLMYGNISGSIVSRFVSEIPEHLIDRLRGNKQQTLRSAHSRKISLDNEVLDELIDDELDIETFLEL